MRDEPEDQEVEHSTTGPEQQPSGEPGTADVRDAEASEASAAEDHPGEQHEQFLRRPASLIRPTHGLLKQPRVATLLGRSAISRLSKSPSIANLLDRPGSLGLLSRSGFRQLGHPVAKVPRLYVLKGLRLPAKHPVLAPRVNSASFFPKIHLGAPPRGIGLIGPKLRFRPLPPGLLSVLQRLKESQPPNWPESVDLDEVITAIQHDGLPLVWVPRAAIVADVLAVHDRAARVNVLLSHADDVVTDCRNALADTSLDTFHGQLDLAAKAIDAFAAGHHEAAQALAVTVTETAVARALGSKYNAVKEQVLFDPELVPYTQMRLRAALAPIGPFYTTWYPDCGAPAPEALSRHVTVHQADSDHYTQGNAIVAVLLATSVLRALQELQELS